MSSEVLNFFLTRSQSFYFIFKGWTRVWDKETEIRVEDRYPAVVEGSEIRGSEDIRAQRSTCIDDFSCHLISCIVVDVKNFSLFLISQFIFIILTSSISFLNRRYKILKWKIQKTRYTIQKWLFWSRIKHERITERIIIITHGYRISTIRGSLGILAEEADARVERHHSNSERTAFHEWRTQGGHPVPFSKRAKRLARFRENV